jgi:hypothetical protein
MLSKSQLARYVVGGGVPEKVTSSHRWFWKFAAPRATSGKVFQGSLVSKGAVERRDTLWRRHHLDVMSAS